MPVISVTRLQLRSAWKLPRFFWHAIASTVQARKTPGNLGVRTFRDAQLAFWTQTAWKDEASARAYMVTGAHRKAITAMQDLSNEGQVAHWEQESGELLPWPAAYQKLLEKGRFTKLRLPSEDHQAGRIRAPRG